MLTLLKCNERDGNRFVNYQTSLVRYYYSSGLFSEVSGLNPDHDRVSQLELFVLYPIPSKRILKAHNV